MYHKQNTTTITLVGCASEKKEPSVINATGKT